MARWRVLIGSRSFGQAAPEHLNRLEAAGCEVIPNQVGRAYRETELLEVLRGADAIITGTDELTAAVITAANQLVTIAKHGVGLDNIDLPAARARGIVVTATPGAIHDSVADMTLALLLALARQIVPADRGLRSGGWPRLTGIELRGRILGIVGLGRIGKEVCRRARAFGMQVVAHDLSTDDAFAETHGVQYVPLEELLTVSDVVSLHAAGSDDGRPLLGRHELTRMKPGAFLINTARGTLVDGDALAEALRAGRLGGAGLDVFTFEPPVGSPLIGLENVVLTPHLAGQTKEGLLRMGEMTVENCLCALRGETPPFQVN